MTGRIRLTRSLLALLTAVLLSALAASCVLLERAPGAGAPTVLLSIDQTWWNRLGLNQFTYVRALRRAGLNVRIARFSDIDEWSAEDTARLLSDVSGIVISGGGDVDPRLYGGDPRIGLEVKPKRDRFELDLLAAARIRELPVLGICRGEQLMNVALGGSLLSFRDQQERRQRHKRLTGGHPVTLAADSQLAEIYGKLELENVRSYHGQAVDRPGTGVVIAGRSPDGTIEAIELAPGTELPWLGVQWHAETQLFNGEQQALFDAFAHRVRASAPENVTTDSTDIAVSPQG